MQGQCEGNYRADLEYLFEVLDSTDLNIDARRFLYGLDTEKIKKSFLEQVDTIHSQVDFYRLVQRLLGSLHDRQARTIYPGNAYWLKTTKDEFVVFSKIFDSNRIEDYYSVNRGFRGHWEKDTFYLGEEGSVVTSDGAKIALNRKTKLLSVDGIPVAVLRDQSGYDNTDDVCFDQETKRAFPKSLFPRKEVVFGMEDGDSAVVACPYVFRVSEPWKPNNGLPYSFVRDSGKVFVKIYLCNLKHKDWAGYEKLIARLRRTQVDKEIIIDARYCDIDADIFWQKLLGLLVDRDLTYSMNLAAKKSKHVYDFLNVHASKVFGKNRKDIKEAKIAALNENIYTFTKEIEIKRDKKGLNHEGKIMILFDENVSFSSLALLRFANKFPDNFITAGKKMDYLGGIGLPPFEYVLPYSKIMIRLPAAMEINPESKIEERVDYVPMFENNVNALHYYRLDKNGDFVQ